MPHRTKHKLELEFSLQHVSSKSLYGYIFTPEGLEKWFADKVTVSGDLYNFIWDGEDHKARLSTHKENKSVKYKWESDDHTYLSMEIQKDELTGDIALAITDFYTEEDKDERIMIWNNQIGVLAENLGILI